MPKFARHRMSNVLCLLSFKKDMVFLNEESTEKKLINLVFFQISLKSVEDQNKES